MNKEQTLEEKWENAGLENNFIFYHVFHNNPDLCKILLEILLKIEIDHIEMHNEETIIVDYEAKGVRLDVYAKNETQAFNLEIEVADFCHNFGAVEFAVGVENADKPFSHQVVHALFVERKRRRWRHVCWNYGMVVGNFRIIEHLAAFRQFCCE